MTVSGQPAAHAPRKRFGQHFLIDPAAIDAIVRAIAPAPGQALVEIGPGLGALTTPLLNSGAALTVIELDRDLAARWRAQAMRSQALQVIEADVLKVDFTALAAAAGTRLRIIGNLPYNISSPILLRLTAAAQHLHDVHVMLQKEVVERMAAGPGSKAYGRLSVMLQWRFTVVPVLDVPPAAFDPPPKVDSAVAWLKPCTECAPIKASTLEQLTAAAFSQRRKVLRHSLAPWLTARVDTTFGFDMQRRAEEVSVAEYLDLAQRIEQLTNQEQHAH